MLCLLSLILCNAQSQQKSNDDVYSGDMRESAKTPGSMLRSAGSSLIVGTIIEVGGVCFIASTDDKDKQKIGYGLIGIGLLSQFIGYSHLVKAGKLLDANSNKHSDTGAIYLEPAKQGIGICMRF